MRLDMFCALNLHGKKKTAQRNTAAVSRIPLDSVGSVKKVSENNYALRNQWRVPRTRTIGTKQREMAVFCMPVNGHASRFGVPTVSHQCTQEVVGGFSSKATPRANVKQRLSTDQNMFFLDIACKSIYIYIIYIYHKKQPNVGKYTSPMDGMGLFFIVHVMHIYGSLLVINGIIMAL